VQHKRGDKEMLEPNDKVAISLTITEWNQILAMLSGQPFKDVAGLIGQITLQAQTAVAASDQSPASYLNSLNGEQQGPLDQQAPLGPGQGP
jgi:hypothetical protein